ncbi:MAG: ADP-ribosylglycohydrolase family protein [Dehalococcoidia bacterium]
MDEAILKSKFLGALVGTGLGDALGAPFEGQRRVKPEEIDWIAERLETLTYTDDTHMTIGVAESLLRAGGFDGADMAHTFAYNYELEPWRGYGPGPPHIFRLIRAGGAWDKVAQGLYRSGSYGNGAAMRIAPIGVLYHNNLPLLTEIAHKSSQITHTHKLGKEGAALEAHAIALATSLEPGKNLDQGSFLKKLMSHVSDRVYQEKLSRIPALLNHPDKDLVTNELGNGIEAFNSVPTAIYCFLNEPDSFARAVRFAISLGGDTDTIGAMTGAISGAYLGASAMPHQWRGKLENEKYLAKLAEELYRLFISMN